MSATGEASPGNYELDITSLATAEKNRSTSTFADKYDEITAGTISIAVDGEDVARSPSTRAMTSRQWSTKSTQPTQTFRPP